MCSIQPPHVTSVMLNESSAVGALQAGAGVLGYVYVFYSTAEGNTVKARNGHQSPLTRQHSSTINRVSSKAG